MLYVWHHVDLQCIKHKIFNKKNGKDLQNLNQTHSHRFPHCPNQSNSFVLPSYVQSHHTITKHLRFPQNGKYNPTSGAHTPLPASVSIGSRIVTNNGDEKSNVAARKRCFGFVLQIHTSLSRFKSYYGVHIECPVFLSNFNQSYNFSTFNKSARTKFHKNPFIGS